MERSKVDQKERVAEVYPRLMLKCTILAALVSLAISAAEQNNAVISKAGLPTLHTAYAAHHLTLNEVKRAYPVHLRCVVLYYDPYLYPNSPLLFTADSTGGIFVALPAALVVPLKPGSLIDVTGFTNPGDFAPMVVHGQVRVIGEASSPSFAPRVSLTQLLTGEEDAQLVEVEGIVHSVLETDKDTLLTLALSDGEITATTLRVPGSNYEHLIDAKVRLRGATGPVYNNHHQQTGARLFFPGLKQIIVEKPAPDNPFSSQRRAIKDLLQYRPNTSADHRVHVRGTVTLFWPNRVVCIQDGTDGLCAPDSSDELSQGG